MRRTHIAALLAAAAAAFACGKKRITVHQNAPDATGEFGKVALEEAVQKFRASPTDPAAYRTFVLEVNRLRPAFNQPVADIAERQLAFLSLEPMAAQLDKPLAQQLDALATTVWPTAFNVEPQANESPRAYLERVCSGSLATECKYIVPEEWPRVLSAMVWRRMRMRAREAYGECRMCKQDPSFPQMLERLDLLYNRVLAVRAKLGDRADRDAWPEAGSLMAAWSNPPLLDLVADPFTFDGADFDGDWQDRIRARPKGATALGLHVRPRTEVRHVRAVLRGAARAGYRSVALQVRGRSYPYLLGEYHLTTGRGDGQTVDIRDVDTVQILVRALDAASGRAIAGKPPGGPPPVTRLTGS